MKIGILGGTFDPIHLGHLEMAKAALSELKLDKVIFMPCYIPPHKTRRDIASPQDRLEMIRLAIEDDRKYELSDYEISRRGISFTVNMLKDFKRLHPDDEIYFIIGSDSYLELHTWKDYSSLPKLAKLVIIQRPPYICEPLNPDIEKVEMAPSPISSSNIRSNIKQGKSISRLIPEEVAYFIIAKNLYK